MKRIVFFQKSIILSLVLSLLLIIVACAITGIVLVLQNIKNASIFDWVNLLCCILVAVIFGYKFIAMVKNRIILEEDKIFVPAYWGGRDVKLQYETEIKYSEIINIFIISSFKNSINKSLKWVTLPMPYIVFDCQGDTQKAINVFYYSKKQIIKIIDRTKERAMFVGNKVNIKSGQEILFDFLETQKLKK